MPQLATTLPPPPPMDVEEARPERPVAVAATKEGWEKKKAVTLVLRALALLFSFITFMLIVTISNFSYYPVFSYVFAISLLVLIYTAVFVGIHGHEVRTGEVVIPSKVALWINFLGDQILALMLLSSASASAEGATAFRQEYYGPTIDKMTASVAMAFLAFFALEGAALISTYNFSVHLSKS